MTNPVRMYCPNCGKSATGRAEQFATPIRCPGCGQTGQFRASPPARNPAGEAATPKPQAAVHRTQADKPRPPKRSSQGRMATDRDIQGMGRSARLVGTILRIFAAFLFIDAAIALLVAVKLAEHGVPSVLLVLGLGAIVPVWILVGLLLYGSGGVVRHFGAMMGRILFAVENPE